MTNSYFFCCRYDLGSGAAKIVSENKVRLKQWNSIKVERDRKRGELALNNVTHLGESKGRLTGLNVRGPVNVGGLKTKTDL